MSSRSTVLTKKYDASDLSSPIRLGSAGEYERYPLAVGDYERVARSPSPGRKVVSPGGTLQRARRAPAGYAPIEAYEQTYMTHRTVPIEREVGIPYEVEVPFRGGV